MDKMKGCRLFFWSCLAAFFIFGAARLYFKLTDDFRIANITYKMPHHPEWNIPIGQEEKERLHSILKQKFTYIGKGAQSYAFSSADDRYVLKFFKFKHLTPHWFVELFPPLPPFSTYREKQAIRKNRKLYGVFEGYNLAYAIHREPSGLIYAHLNTTTDQHPQITVVDKIGFERKIDLDSVPFLIQEKAKTTRAVINEALKKGDLQLAESRIGQIFDLYMTEYNKGIYDKDHGVMHNTGFVGEYPIHLDVGKLTKEEEMKRPELWQPDMEHIAWKFAVWIRNNYPNDYPVLASAIEMKLTHLFGRPFDFNTSQPPPPKKLKTRLFDKLFANP